MCSITQCRRLTNGALVFGEQNLKSRDYGCRRARLDLDDQAWEARRHGRREVHRRVEYEGDVEIHEDLHHGGTVPIHQIYVQDRGAYDPGRKQGQGFLATRGRTEDFAADVLHGERQVQGNEGLILGHED